MHSYYIPVRLNLMLSSYASTSHQEICRNQRSFVIFYYTFLYIGRLLDLDPPFFFFFISDSIPVAPTWSIGHPWNARFTQFLKLRQSVGLLGRGSALRKAAIWHKHRINTDIYAFSGTRTYDSSVLAGEDISCPKPHGHCDRRIHPPSNRITYCQLSAHYLCNISSN
jgi:hypothetical protein